MDKFVVKGTKKLLSLARTKIRLAEEAETVYTKPRPLPLVKLLSGREIKTIKDAKAYRDELVQNLDFSDSRNAASTILQVMDIIEGVKYKFEPPQFCSLLNEEQLDDVEKEAKENSMKVNLLLMTRNSYDGINLYIGDKPIDGVIHFGRVSTTLSFFLNFAFNSNYLSEKTRLKNVNSCLGHKTLILNAVHFALGEFGAGLECETLFQ